MKRLDVYVVGPYTLALILSCGLYYYALQIAPAPDGHLGPDFWPKTILILAIVTCVWKIGRSLMGGPVTGSGASVHDDLAASSALHGVGGPHNAHELTPMTPWIGVGLTAMYVFAFPWLGYPLSTCAYVAAFVYFGNFRRPLIAACLGIVASLTFMFLFMRVVYVSLPIGVEPFAQISTLLMSTMGVK